MDRSEQINELAAALAKAQGEMENAAKDCKNTFYNSRYADLASCWEAVREPLSRNGLSLVQMPSTTPDSRIVVTTVLSHSSGQWIASTLELQPVREKKGEGYVPANDPQAMGSAITYARRYALAAMCGIAQDDDDAEAAQGRPPQQQRREPPAKANGKSTPTEKPPEKHTGRLGEIEKGKIRGTAADKLPPIMDAAVNRDMDWDRRLDVITTITEAAAITAEHLKRMAEQIKAAPFDADKQLALLDVVDKALTVQQAKEAHAATK